jgi:hypothetical protein
MQTLFWFFFTKTKLLKPISAHTKSSVLMFRTFKKYSSRDIMTLNPGRYPKMDNLEKLARYESISQSGA